MYFRSVIIILKVSNSSIILIQLIFHVCTILKGLALTADALSAPTGSCHRVRNLHLLLICSSQI